MAAAFTRMAAALSPGCLLPTFTERGPTESQVRACRRYDEAAVPAARELLAGIDLIPLTAELVESVTLAALLSFAPWMPSIWPVPAQWRRA
jgi:hypothetical protein